MNALTFKRGGNFVENESKRPGGELPDWQLYQVRVDQETGKEKGVDTPDGVFYPFNNGERFVQEGTEREPFIINKDGNKIRFEDWEKEQEK